MSNKKIKVLVVDDSLLSREFIIKGITQDPEISVVARAADPFEARDKIIKFKPDVMTCDIQMPKMDGIEFIKRLIPQYPLPTVVVSTISDAIFDALYAGAVEFVTKPDISVKEDADKFIERLIKKIKIAANSKIGTNKNEVAANSFDDKAICNNKVIAIGSSTGGTEAIYNLLKGLPNNVPGIVIVQHIPPVFSKMFAERLNHQTQFKVKEAVTGDIIEPGSVFIAPGDKHMRIKKHGDRYKIECFEGDKVNGHCPSVDVLFESVATVAKENAVGVILTGMGYDGAKGLLSMKRKGAKTIGQDEESCVVYGMPMVANNIGAVDVQAALNDIPSAIIKALK